VSRARRLNIFIVSSDGSRPVRVHLPGWAVSAAVVGVTLGFTTVSVLVGDYIRVRKLAASPAALQRELAEQHGIVTALRKRIAEIRLEVGSWRELDAKIWEPFGPDVGLVRRTPGIGGATALPEPAGHRPSALEELDGLADTVGAAGKNLRALERLMEHAGKALALMPSRWPVRGAVNSEFGTRPSPWTGAEEFHSGLDIAADRGAGVHAPAPGTVVFAGEQGEFGLCLILEHGHDIRTIYGHLSKLLAAPGQQVVRGQLIALTGNTGKSSGPHLHYEIVVKGHSVNPRLYMWN
jgi:murein DD-endopeptidase MepM/ murein hydrolase activator NlpD